MNQSTRHNFNPTQMPPLPPLPDHDDSIDRSAAALPSQITIGIDWADREHAFAATLPDGSIESGDFTQKPEAIQCWVEAWRKRIPGVTLIIAIETSRGALINALLQLADVSIFPVNPHAMACYRKVFAHGGGKSDPVDARLIMQYLLQNKTRMRPLQQKSPLTRELDALVRHRRDLVEQRVALGNKLFSLLKEYFPAMTELRAAKPYAHFIIAMLLRWPTLEAVQKAGAVKIRKLFFGLGSKARIEVRIETLIHASPLSTDADLSRIRGAVDHAMPVGKELLPVATGQGKIGQHGQTGVGLQMAADHSPLLANAYALQRGTLHGALGSHRLTTGRQAQRRLNTPI